MNLICNICLEITLLKSLPDLRRAHELLKVNECIHTVRRVWWLLAYDISREEITCWCSIPLYLLVTYRLISTLKPWLPQKMLYLNTGRSCNILLRTLPECRQSLNANNTSSGQRNSSQAMTSTNDKWWKLLPLASSWLDMTWSAARGLELPAYFRSFLHFRPYSYIHNKQ